jgi:hypothetical protein
MNIKINALCKDGTLFWAGVGELIHFTFRLLQFLYIFSRFYAEHLYGTLRMEFSCLQNNICKVYLYLTFIISSSFLDKDVLLLANEWAFKLHRKQTVGSSGTNIVHRVIITARPQQLQLELTASCFQIYTIYSAYILQIKAAWSNNEQKLNK